MGPEPGRPGGPPGRCPGPVPERIGGPPGRGGGPEPPGRAWDGPPVRGPGVYCCRGWAPGCTWGRRVSVEGCDGRPGGGAGGLAAKAGVSWGGATGAGGTAAAVGGASDTGGATTAAG